MKSHVVIKSSKSGMSLILDPDCAFDELIQEIRDTFAQSARFWGNVQIALILEGRVLTAIEELKIVDAITDNSDIRVLCLIEQDPARIEQCEKALSQKLMELGIRTGQFCRGDLHRGETLECEASVVVIGDVQHGARVTAKGNIIVLGELRGSAYAGASGNTEAVIVALEMLPLQIRIASISRHFGDKRRRPGKGPMIACVENRSICTKPLKKDLLSMFKF